jgi:hypothetical protein
VAAEYGPARAPFPAYGCRNPIIIYEGKISDGQSRYKICQELGIECPTREKKFKKAAKAQAYVISQNIKRRHLNY